MSKGYICLVQNNKDTDYLQLAYTLALSIKLTQTTVNKLSIVTDCKVSKKYKQVFDEIIYLKKDRAKNEDWKLHNIVDLYEYTPYDETVILDSDMLFLSDVSQWWNKLSERDMWFTSQIKSYRNTLVEHRTPYREEFVLNKLPNVYMAFSYFKRNQTAENIFNQAQFICDNWDVFVNKFLFKRKPKVFSTDVAFALAVKTLGLTEKTIVPFCPFPYITHMKTLNQNWLLEGYEYDEDWRVYTPIGFDVLNNSLGIKVGGVRQTGIFHYHVKDFLDDEQISILEDLNNGR